MPDEDFEQTIRMYQIHPECCGSQRVYYLAVRNQEFSETCKNQNGGKKYREFVNIAEPHPARQAVHRTIFSRKIFQKAIPQSAKNAGSRTQNQIPCRAAENRRVIQPYVGSNEICRDKIIEIARVQQPLPRNKRNDRPKYRHKKNKIQVHSSVNDSHKFVQCRRKKIKDYVAGREPRVAHKDRQERANEVDFANRLCGGKKSERVVRTFVIESDCRNFRKEKNQPDYSRIKENLLPNTEHTVLRKRRLADKI